MYSGEASGEFGEVTCWFSLQLLYDSGIAIGQLRACQGIVTDPSQTSSPALGRGIIDHNIRCNDGCTHFFIAWFQTKNLNSSLSIILYVILIKDIA
jgi:hypothetical protein